MTGQRPCTMRNVFSGCLVGASHQPYSHTHTHTWNHALSQGTTVFLITMNWTLLRLWNSLHWLMEPCVQTYLYSFISGAEHTNGLAFMLDAWTGCFAVLHKDSEPHKKKNDNDSWGHDLRGNNSSSPNRIDLPPVNLWTYILNGKGTGGQGHCSAAPSICT